MKEENKKEKITIEQILGDIKMLCKYNIAYDCVFLSIVTILLSPILFFKKIEYVTPIFFLFFLSAVFYFGYDIFIHFKILININNGGYEIVTDKLVEKKHIDVERYNPFKPKINLIFDTPNIFYFSKHKKYRIPTGKSYSFSQKNCMNSDGIYGTANIGDEFYLIVIDEKIIQIYNTNFFDFN